MQSQLQHYYSNTGGRIAHDKSLPFDDEIPKPLTQQTMEQLDRGEDLHGTNNPDDLYRQLDIRCSLKSTPRS